MNHLTLLKKEALKDFRKIPHHWVDTVNIQIGNAKTYKFIESLIDRIHAHTLEEVRAKIESLEQTYITDRRFKQDILAALELLEHPTD